MKIAVYAISKNEEQFVERFCKSCEDADMVIIADTGSTDRTVEVAKECGAVVHEIAIMPWRFDKARDAALALVPRDVDVCVSLDLDEVLMSGWRQELERVWEPGKTTRMRYKFDWSMGVVFYSEKIHARSGYHWHHPCHEYIRADKRTVESFATTDTLLVQHLPDASKSRGQYMDLLKMSVEEDPHCPRNAFYYARELTYYERWEEAVKELQRYLEMPNATWDCERAYAMRLIGVSMDKQGQDGMYWFRLACATAPYMREPWVELADACYRRGNWEECYGAATSALKIKDRQLNYTVRPESWGYKPHDLAAIAAYRLGLKEKAIEHGQKALEFEPHNERLIKNMEYYNGSN